jgi:lipopolysaccharide biosynthesis regulator YciM
MMTRRLLVLALLMAGPSACGESQALRDRAAIKREVSPRELLRKGDASASLGDMTRAEQYYVMAQKAGADEHQVVQRLLVACVADQRYPVALEYAERHLRRHPQDVEVRFATASLRAALGDLTAARDMMLEVLRERPTWAEAHYALGSVLRQIGEQQPLADEHDIEYLRLSPQGTYAEAARDRLRRNPQ